MLYGPDDQMIGERFPLPALPSPGLRISWGSGMWEVTQVMMCPAERGSFAAEKGDPVLVDVRVVPAQGIHD